MSDAKTTIAARAGRELKDGQRVKITGKLETGPKEKEKAK